MAGAACFMLTCVAGVSAVQACWPTRHDFNAALYHVQGLLGAGAAVWVVDVLTSGDDLEILALDAPGAGGVARLRPRFEPASSGLRPLRIRVRGTPDRDLLAGEWSDDTVLGDRGETRFS